MKIVNMELDFIKEMFDLIAPRYDFLNRLLSLRQDVYWRRTMISALNLPENAQILDVACGTGRNLLYLAQSGYEAVGLDIVAEEYVLAQNGQRMFGVYQLSQGTSELSWSIGIRNSMNKSMSIGSNKSQTIFGELK